jgi:hypothetical protein
MWKGGPPPDTGNVSEKWMKNPRTLPLVNRHGPNAYSSLARGSPPGKPSMDKGDFFH